MSQRTLPVIKLFRNPWKTTLADGVVLQILLTAATQAEEELQHLIEAGEVEPERNSFGAVLLDPTRPRSAVTFTDRVLATITLGPDGVNFLPNAAAKADAHDRHGRGNEELVAHFSHCLSDDDFAWGDSAEYELAVGGGSGLSSKQDGTLVLEMLTHLVHGVNARRNQWLAERRRQGSHGWYNPANTPGAEYAAIVNQTGFVLPSYNQMVDTLDGPRPSGNTWAVGPFETDAPSGWYPA